MTNIFLKRDQRSASSDQRAASSEQRAASSEQRAASSENLVYYAPHLVATVLICSAALKAHRLITESPAALGVLQSNWFQITLIAAESSFGLALWYRLRPTLTRVVVILLFACFLGAALSQAISGARSCACFGKVDVDPWLAVGLDAAVIAVLVWWTPPISNDSFAKEAKVDLCGFAQGVTQ